VERLGWSTRRGRPERGSSSSPARPRSAYRVRHASTVGRETPTRSAIATFDSPSAASNTIRARCAAPAAIVEDRTCLLSTSRSPSCRPNGFARTPDCPSHPIVKQLTTRDTSLLKARKGPELTLVTRSQVARRVAALRPRTGVVETITSRSLEEVRPGRTIVATPSGSWAGRCTPMSLCNAVASGNRVEGWNRKQPVARVYLSLTLQGHDDLPAQAQVWGT
jgi:hypothetical protein